VEDLLQQIWGLIQGLLALADTGFDGVNQVVGLVIAAIAALVMTHWRGLWATALGAALVHILIGMLKPMLDGGSLVLPDILSAGFWIAGFALFLGYAIVIAIFFFIKSLLTGSLFRSHRTSHAH
jgi:hypothetical protein